MNPHQAKKIDVKVRPQPPSILSSPCPNHPKLTHSPQSLSPEEQRLFRLYGKLPSRSDHFAKHLKERKYFDSGDYAMSKAGKGDSVDTGSVGSQHPVPEDIPHLSSPVSGPGGGGGGGAQQLLPAHHHHHLLAHGNGGSGLQQAAAGSPVKESSFLGREMVAGEEGEGVEGEVQQQQQQGEGQAVAAQAAALPLRG